MEKKARTVYKHLIQVDSTSDGQTEPRASCSTSESTDGSPAADRLLDTVGAVCVDAYGRISSAVSSGGIVLKQPGRLGQAALYACGCWAEMDQNNEAVGVSTSGSNLTVKLVAKYFR